MPRAVSSVWVGRPFRGSEGEWYRPTHQEDFWAVERRFAAGPLTLPTGMVPSIGSPVIRTVPRFRPLGGADLDADARQIVLTHVGALGDSAHQRVEILPLKPAMLCVGANPRRRTTPGSLHSPSISGSKCASETPFRFSAPEAPTANS